eukprot:15330743-Ditylum_brightwellii.AAC.1
MVVQRSGADPAVVLVLLQKKAWIPALAAPCCGSCVLPLFLHLSKQTQLVQWMPSLLQVQALTHIDWTQVECRVQSQHAPALPLVPVFLGIVRRRPTGSPVGRKKCRWRPPLLKTAAFVTSPVRGQFGSDLSSDFTHRSGFPTRTRTHTDTMAIAATFANKNYYRT